MNQRPCPSSNLSRFLALGLVALGSSLAVAGCTSGSGEAERGSEHLGSVEQAASTGTGNYKIRTQRDSKYLRINAGALTWDSATGDEFYLKYDSGNSGNVRIKHVPSGMWLRRNATNDTFVADQSAESGAELFVQTACGSYGGDARYGFTSTTDDSSPYLKTDIAQVTASNGSACAAGNASAWEGFYLTPSGTVCTPSCSGKQCGADGCNSVCGTCASDQICSTGSQCVPVCTPNCTGKECGSNGCGGSCGTCTAPETCDASQQCVASSSGGTFFKIQTNRDVNKYLNVTGNQLTWSADIAGAGVFEKIWVDQAADKYKLKAPNGSFVRRNNQTDDVLYADTNEAGAEIFDSNSCGAGKVNMLATTDDSSRAVATEGDNSLKARSADTACGGWEAYAFVETSGGTCTPNCVGRACGSNGCNGTCGSCSAGQTCNTSFQCVSSCTPNCAGKSCGPDGCFGTCGTCSSSMTCNASQQCVTDSGSGGSSQPYKIKTNRDATKFLAVGAANKVVWSASEATAGQFTKVWVDQAADKYKLKAPSGSFVRRNNDTDDLLYADTNEAGAEIFDSNSCSGSLVNMLATTDSDANKALAADGVDDMKARSVTTACGGWEAFTFVGTDAVAGCNDGIQNGGETGTDCGGPCLPCGFPTGKSFKRGVAYHFCGWPDSRGQQDLDDLKGGMSWYYNWGVEVLSPAQCNNDGYSIKSSPDINTTVEFVPMLWGLNNKGANCATGGGCFVGGSSGLTVNDAIARMAPATRFLLGFNEPNFKHQSNLTPREAASKWTHLEYVARSRNLKIVGPAGNYCDASGGPDHGGVCTQENTTVTYSRTAADGIAYSVTFNSGAFYNVFTWLELFYDECSTKGVAAHDCQIDFQAGHVYSFWGAYWFVDKFKIKAGLMPGPTHCTDGVKNIDEFGVDCGGNECKACSNYARAKFQKQVWITEFSPSTDDAGYSPTWQQKIDRTMAFIDEEIPKFESDPYVYRYAWFMPKTNIASLDHADLLTIDPVDRTVVGQNYLTEGF